MILTTLAAADRYFGSLPGLSAALAFLRASGRLDLADGKHAIDSDRLYAVVAHYRTRDPETVLPEAHRRYVDVQYLVSGQETIWWTPLADVGAVSEPYDAERDVEFYSRSERARRCELSAGQLAIFFPDDAHQPGCHVAAAGDVHKIVVKVRLG